MSSTEQNLSRCNLNQLIQKVSTRASGCFLKRHNPGLWPWLEFVSLGKISKMSHVDTLPAHIACFNEKNYKSEGIPFIQGPNGWNSFCSDLKWFIAVTAGRMLWQAADYSEFAIPLCYWKGSRIPEARLLKQDHGHLSCNAHTDRDCLIFASRV